MNHFDVVVVGGGPSGSAAAISCAQRGLRVAQLEGRCFPRFRPGESLHPGIEPLLRQLGVADLLCKDAIRFTGQWVQWDGPPRFNGFGGDDAKPWQGFQITRARLDSVLLQQAVGLGVTVLQPCQARGLLTRNRRVIGLQSDAGSLLTPYVIDASGATGWLNRHYPSALRRHSPLLIARYGYHKGCIHPYEQAPHLLADLDGWTWIARVDDRVLHWTRLCFDKRSHLFRTVPERLQVLPTVGPVRGADVSWRISTSPAGAGFFRVGDAACVLDPAASHGVLKALMTGMQAAQAVFDCLQQPWLESEAQAQYSQWISEWFERDLTQMRHFYSTHPHPPDWLGNTSG
ncbi:tryptophan 7-halogenase [Pseudomonas sp. C32]|uniref:NAD(P)/FAD-dependent oxidoreductase n=1 Tax=Pseudomonas sp. C32 TaxID=1529208 RepID=UPI00262D61A2|nr:tryptophan 7-halogenase [Pseudomonas sp. C32]MDN4544613.1 tryptophan 7-halogenase [Pseudomonas sp. C32]